MPKVVVFSLKCCQCGHLFTARSVDIDPEDGPSCPRCMGPCEVEAAQTIVERA